MHIFRHIFLSNYWWQESDIWSQASYFIPHIVGSVFGPIRFLLPVCWLSWFLYTLNIYAGVSYVSISSQFILFQWQSKFIVIVWNLPSLDSTIVRKHREKETLHTKMHKGSLWYKDSILYQCIPQGWVLVLEED